MKIEDAECVVDYISVTISGIKYRDPNKHYIIKEQLKEPFEKKTQTFTFFYERNGEIHAATNEEHSHMGAGFFEDAFGKEQIKQIKKICKKAGNKMIGKAEDLDYRI